MISEVVLGFTNTLFHPADISCSTGKNSAHVFLYRKTENLDLPLISSRKDSGDLICYTQDQVSEENMKSQVYDKMRSK